MGRTVQRWQSLFNTTWKGKITMEWITGNYDTVIDIGSKIIALAAAIAAITPTKVDNDLLNKLLGFLNLLGLNILKAKNKDDE